MIGVLLSVAIVQLKIQTSIPHIFLCELKFRACEEFEPEITFQTLKKCQTYQFNQLLYNKQLIIGMQNAKKSYRYEPQDPNSSASKQDRISQRLNPNSRQPNDGTNKSLESRGTQNRKPSQQLTSLHVEELPERSQLGRALRSSKEQREAKPGIRAGERQAAYNQSQETIKIKTKQESSVQKNAGTAKSKQYHFKQPEWLKYRHKGSKPEQINKFQFIDQDVHTTATNHELLKMRSESTIYQAVSTEYLSPNVRNGNRPVPSPEHGFHDSRSNLRLSRMEYLQITNIKLEEEVKELKYKLENLEEDNNILLGRMQTLEAELGLSNKKVTQYAVREQYHRTTEQKLRQKIQDLQGKLILAKDQMSGKNQIYDSGFHEGFSNILNNDREVVQKKNEEISRLNEIVNKTRVKVNELNHLMSQERIGSLQSLRLLEQKYETMLEKKESQIKELKRIVEFRRDRPFNYIQQSRRVTENNPLNFPKATEDQLKRVVSANLLHRDVPFIKFSN